MGKIFIIFFLFTFIFLLAPKPVKASCDLGRTLKTDPNLNTIIAQAKNEELHCEGLYKVYNYKTSFVIRGKNIGDFRIADQADRSKCPIFLESEPAISILPVQAGSPELPVFQAGKKYILSVPSSENNFVSLPQCYLGIAASEIKGFYDPRILFFAFQAYGYPVLQLTLLMFFSIAGIFYVIFQSDAVTFTGTIILIILIYILIIFLIIKFIKKLRKIIFSRHRR